MTTVKLYNTLAKELRSYLKPFDEKLLKKAFDFAKMAHGDQVRKSGEPYINHPVNAAIILASMQVDMPTIITCILHDVPEDTKYTIEDVREKFGDKVAELVAGVTKLSAVYYKNNMKDRQIDTLRRMFLVMSKDIRVVLVRLSDRLHNLRTLDAVKQEKAYRIAKESMEIYSPLANLLGIWEIRQEIDAICFKYVYPNEYKSIYNVVKKHREEMGKYVKKVEKQVIQILTSNHVNLTVDGRWKHMYSIYKKMKRDKKTVPELYDVPAIRLIVNNIPDCYKTLGILHGIWKPKPNMFKDCIAVPRPNGYQSLHTTVFGPDGQLVEFQIRTKNMDLQAKFGITSQFIYKRKGKKKDINSFLEETPWVQKILKIQKKDNLDFLEDLKTDVLSDRIFLFTETGEVIDLPKGASTLDFAYRLSTRIGNSYSYALVNKEKKLISYDLVSGDIVKIITDKKVKPQRDWLYYAVTEEAKDSIKHFFKKRSKIQRERLGEMILNNITDTIIKTHYEMLSNNEKNKIAKLFGYTDQFKFLVSVGSGEISEAKLSREILYNKEDIFIYADFYFIRLFSRFFKKKVGIGKQKVCLRLILKDKVGALSDVLEVIARNNSNIVRISASNKKQENSVITFIKIEMSDPSRLKRLLNEINGLEGVDDIDRRRPSKFIYLLFTVIGLAIWIAHPVLLAYFQELRHLNERLYLNLFWISGLLILMLLSYLRKMALYFPPKPLGKTKFAIFLNFTMLLIVGTLILEVFESNLGTHLFIFTPLVLASLIFMILYQKSDS